MRNYRVTHIRITPTDSGATVTREILAKADFIARSATVALAEARALWLPMENVEYLTVVRT